ncbi:LOW QUALITY PROTEIN: sterile alpha motif domain-containing protein 9-like [Spinachia spinachia]
MAQRAQRRKQAEEKHLNVIKSSTQGSRLSQLITGGSFSLDKSHFERYIIVTNKSHEIPFESLGFLVELNPIAVLDFDPESAKDGLKFHFKELSTVNDHLPARYKITEAVEDIANQLKTRITSWVFCNGGIGKEEPVDINEWLMDKGSSIRDVISFLCRKDVLPDKRFLVIFLLWSTVSEKMDPLVETFSMFYQELKGAEQILCICDNENACTSWTNLVDARCGIKITQRCIHELSFPEVNGTVLSLLSKNRRSSRFLPCGGGSKILLEKKVERDLNTLNVLCVNQCEGGNDNKIVIEENFYKGGQVSWWNFYFSEQPGSIPFIKRDMFDFIKGTVIPDLCSLGKACVLFNLMHVPGCGGTTLAMQSLWAHRDRFRCAVLRDRNADFAEVADQVVKLLMCGREGQLPRVPVLLMIDDFDDKEKVFDLQRAIDEECAKKNIQSKSAQVILLNCMMSESSEQTEQTEESVFIGNNLSKKEQELFEEKLVAIEKEHKNADTFYGFMIMKKSHKPEYVQGVARKTLKSFNMKEKHAQLFAVVLLNVYCKGSSLSISLCEEFLGCQPKPIFGTTKVEDRFGKFSTLIATCSIEGKVVFKAVKIIHSNIAKHCLEELTTTYNVNQAEITDLLLTTDKFYESTQGKGKLQEDVCQILVMRHYSVEECQFSPLIQNIASESPGLEEMVLQNASKRFDKNAVVSQLLKDFSMGVYWASRARELSKDSSYFADTSAQVVKHELKNAIANCREGPIPPSKLEILLKMAQSATDAFKETQSLAKKESSQRLRSFNTAGCLGEIQVGVLVIKVLEQTPVFASDNVRHDIMSEVLSGHATLGDVEKNDKRHNKHTQHYEILKQFESLLYNLRCRMKENFDFLDNFSVNLGSRSGMKDSREQVAQRELFRCFRQYAEVFCKTDSAALLRNKVMSSMLKLHQERQYLEMNKADSFSGILNYLSKDTKRDSLEEIARLSASVFASGQSTVKERTNFIYVNVVLSHIKPASNQILPYRKLIDHLCQVLWDQIPLRESLPLNFITVVLFWPQQPSPAGFPYDILRRHISQIRTSYYMVMKEVFNEKRPIVHFLLGKKISH